MTYTDTSVSCPGCGIIFNDADALAAHASERFTAAPECRTPARVITPAEALFAIYRSAAENGGSVVYNVPTAPLGQRPNGTVYFITSNDPRVPEERVIFALDADGLPFIVDVVED